MNAIQKYFKQRQQLIDQYAKGDLTKQEYLKENLDMVMSLKIEPFKNINTVEKGLYNYQYFNALAKYMKGLSTSSRMSGDKAQEYSSKANYYYQRKDKATLHVLRLLDYMGVTAYFIQVRSKLLKGILFEIIIENDDFEIILHSTSELILSKLRFEQVFVEETRKSLIDSYINQKY